MCVLREDRATQARPVMLWKIHRSWGVLVLKPNSWPLGAPGKELCPWEGPNDLMSSISRLVLSPGTFITQRG